MNRPTVLVVEDDPSMRAYLEAALRLGGFDVHTAGDGVAALRQIEAQPPDAILLDLDLPLLNGFAVHAMLQMSEHTRHLPVVIATGTGWSAPSPAAATLTKPVLPDDLVAAMFDALARSHVVDEPSRDADRTVLWLCPACGRVARESQETGHFMTSEMRIDAAPCADCANLS
jgi:CheY-like chemotaxis protein